jgi:GT2 family glycosyltransferase
MSRVHLLLPVHNRRSITEDFVKCLRAQTYERVQLVLVDDGSTDGTSDMVSAYLPSVTILRGNGSWWWGGSLQRGMDFLRGGAAAPDDVVLIMNDDTRFEPDFIERGMAALAGRPRSILLAQLYDAKSRKFLESGVHVDWRTMQFRAVGNSERPNCFSTRGLFVRFADMLEIGGFRPVLLPHYGSDYEYTLRARRKGFALATSREVRLWGYEDEHTTGVRDLSRLSGRQFLRVIFSKRAVQNPIYLTSFVLLACPWRHLPGNILRVWIGFLRQAKRALRISSAVAA